MSYTSTASLTDLAERIRNAHSIVCTAHEKPDGDATGSVIAMVRALGVQHHIQGWLLGAVPPPMRALAGDTPWQHIPDATAIPDGEEPDLIIVLDTGAWSQLKPISEWLSARSDRVIGLDHHASGDDVAPARVVDVCAASCTMVVLRLLDALECEIDEQVATPLFAGLATDTGWFRQANGNADAFAVAARLLALGVDKDGVYRMLEETARSARLALQACALSSVQWLQDGRVAIMQLSQDDFDACDGRRSDVTGLVNAPLVVSGSEMACLLIEEPDGAIKASFRSKPPATSGGPFIDVRQLAAQLDGGGHVHAAGATIEASMTEAIETVTEVVSQC